VRASREREGYAATPARKASVEHAQPLRHVIERGGKLSDSRPHALPEQSGRDEKEQRDDEAGGLPIRQDRGKRVGHNLARPDRRSIRALHCRLVNEKQLCM
jgi:hypothetical protein